MEGASNSEREALMAGGRTSTTRRITTRDRIKVDRFFSLIDKNGPVPAHRPELGPCWVWTGQRQPDGRGKFSIDDLEFLASRVAYFLEYGEWPMPCCLHKCDGGEIGCVRPDHLFAGTYADNIRDMVAKGRCKRGAARGEDAGRARLTEQQVIEIRALYARGGTSFVKLGKRFGVGRSTIGAIAMRKSWRHLKEEAAE
jgi:hypothetical protein